MTLVQSHFRGRGDSGALNSASFDHPVDSGWTQVVSSTFRVRFEVDETAGAAEVFTGQLEANLNGGSWFDVSPTSGTVVAALSECFTDGDITSNVILGSSKSFVAGSGSTSGTAVPVDLNDGHTEVEFAVRLSGVANGGTIGLRVADADTYATQASVIALNQTARDRVRLKVGDTDTDDLILTDAQIDAYLVAWPDNVDLAAADAAEAIAAKYSRGFNFSTDGQVFNRRERVAHYMDLASRLRKRGGTFEWPRN
jgi:hypothetical protein